MIRLHVHLLPQTITFNSTTKHNAICVCILFCCIFFVFYILILDLLPGWPVFTNHSMVLRQWWLCYRYTHDFVLL